VFGILKYDVALPRKDKLGILYTILNYFLLIATILEPQLYTFSLLRRLYNPEIAFDDFSDITGDLSVAVKQKIRTIFCI
jgi:hypothetical protein